MDHKVLLLTPKLAQGLTLWIWAVLQTFRRYHFGIPVADNSSAFFVQPKTSH